MVIMCQEYNDIANLDPRSRTCRQSSGRRGGGKRNPQQNFRRWTLSALIAAKNAFCARWAAIGTGGVTTVQIRISVYHSHSNGVLGISYEKWNKVHGQE